MLALISVMIHVLLVDLPLQWDETYVEHLVTASKLKTQIAYMLKKKSLLRLTYWKEKC